MRKLNWDLKRICEENREGSRETQRARSYALRQMANDLYGMGYRGLRAQGLRRKHVEGLVRHWKDKGLTAGTMKNRASHLRWWASHVGRRGVVPSGNGVLEIGERRYVTNEDKSRALEDGKLSMVRDGHVAMSLRLQEAFGLRREECIKFSPSYADRGDRIVLKDTWCKGGRSREVPVATAAQRAVLDAAHAVAGSGALIPPERNYRMQKDVYVEECRRAALDHMHGLRHGYAHRRYEEMTGWRCPALGGPSRRSLRGGRLELDREARLTIARELGHGRIEVAATYLGS